MRRPSVVIVESNTDTRELYAEYLRACRFKVRAVETTDAAFEHAASADAIVTALAVHGSIDGVRLIERLRADEATARLLIVVVTARATGNDRARALAAGCDVFLPKPCLPDLLVREIRRALTLRGAPAPQPASAEPRRDAERHEAS